METVTLSVSPEKYDLEVRNSVSFDDLFRLIAEIRDDFKRVEVSLGFTLSAHHEEIAETKGVVGKQRGELAVWMTIVDQF